MEGDLLGTWPWSSCVGEGGKEKQGELSPYYELCYILMFIVLMRISFQRRETGSQETRLALGCYPESCRVEVPRALFHAT